METVVEDLVEIETFYECVSVTGCAGFCLTKVNITLKKKENPGEKHRYYFVFCRELSIYVWHIRWKKYFKISLCWFFFLVFTLVLLQFHSSLSDNEVLRLMTMYFVKIQRISDTLNPYKSPI